IGDVFFNNSIKVVEQPHVERRSGGYFVRLLLAAVCLGGIAGATGLGTMRFVLDRNRTKATRCDVPPVIRQYQCPKPPYLPPLMR
ncbi:MAG: hypothetical protein D4R57_01780, partial [Verrucomicrobiales bacterium]